RAKVAAGLRHNVFVARRPLAIAAALEQACLDQGLEPPRENVGRDTEALLEFIEPRQAVEGVAQDEHAPPLTHSLQAAGDRTLHLAKALAPHGGPHSLAYCKSYNRDYHYASQFLTRREFFRAPQGHADRTKMSAGHILL